MGGAQSVFSFRISKSGGIVYFVPYNVSGKNTIARIEQTETNVRFYWDNNDYAYKYNKTSGFQILDSSRSDDFSKVTSSYYTEVTQVNNQYVEFTLRAKSQVRYLSWLSMLSIILPGFELKCTCTVSEDSISSTITSMPYSNGFTYRTMIFRGDINNNGVYYNQQGSTVYFNNDTVDVNNVVSAEYEGLSNDNGDYLLGVNINDEGEVVLDSQYMPYIVGTERIDDKTLLIRTSISPDTLTGVLMSNINYNSKFLLNVGMIVDKTSEGILCKNINNGMNLSILATVT